MDLKLQLLDRLNKALLFSGHLGLPISDSSAIIIVCFVALMVGKAHGISTKKLREL